jgi:hypothetical protein
MITSVSTWRCKCGIRIKVVGETDRRQPHVTSVAECPNCGDEQIIYAARIVSTTQESDETAHIQNPE